MTGARRDHSNEIYASKAETQVSWLQETPRLRSNCGARRRDAALGDRSTSAAARRGSSTICLRRATQDVTVLDLSAAAPETAQARRRRGGEPRRLDRCRRHGAGAVARL